MNQLHRQSTDASNKDVVNQAVNTSAPRMRAFSLAAVAADAPVAGKDITNQLTNVTVGIDSGDTVYPHQAGYVKLNYSFSVPNSAVKGDTFKITVPKELNLNGVTSTAKVPPIMAGDQVLANGVIDSDGYEEPEYEKAVKKYQQKFMAEDDALKKFSTEEKNLKNGNKYSNSNKLLGLTHERYLSVFDTLKENKNEFLKEIEEINNKNPELKEFDSEQQNKADLKLNTLENQALMIGYTFYSSNKNEVEDLYNKLDMILGYKDEERKKKKATNQRMFNNKKEDLETSIDDFFRGIGMQRPTSIPTLAPKEEKETNIKNANKLKSDTEEAKSDESKRSKRSLNTQNHKSKINDVNEEQKANYEKKFKEIKERFLAKQKNKNNTPVVSLEYDEDDNENDK